MRVVFNALSLKPEMGGGLTFALNLARALQRGTSDHEVILIGGENNRDLLERTGCRVETIGTGFHRPAKRILTEKLQLSGHLARLGTDVFVSLDGTIPAGNECKTVALLQNLIYFHFDETLRSQPLPIGRRAYARLQSRYFLSGWQQTALRADVCLCVSGVVEQEFVEHYPAMRGKTAVIYEALDDVFVPGDGPDLDQPYLLGVGTLYPNKHFEVLIDLLATLTHVPNLRLKVAGPNWGGQQERLTGHAREMGVAERIDFLGYTPVHEIVKLYQNAICVGLFSECEAYGAPVPEAMACGTPLVVANRSGMAELGGDAVVKVSVDGLRDATQFVERMLTDAAYRQIRRDLALERAKQFHWRTVADQYWKLFESLVPAAAVRGE